MKIIVLNKKLSKLLILTLVAFTFLLMMLIFFTNNSTQTFNDPGNRVIVVDAGHGGIDGGTVSGEFLEKEINLDIAKRLKSALEIRGYKIILTREEDKSLDNLSDISGSRHQRDLNARTCIINSSNAQMFLSIHVNCHTKNPNANGAIVFFNDKFTQSSILALSIQRAINKIVFEGKKQTIHDPQKGNYYLLAHSNMPGVIIETAFLSNESDKKNLMNHEFKEMLAWAISDGVDKYLESLKLCQAHFPIK